MCCTYQATEFVELLGGQKSVYGYHCDSLKSLLISLLPPIGFKIKDNFKADGKDGPSIEVSFMESLLNALRDSAGFRIPVVSAIDVLTFVLLFRGLYSIYLVGVQPCIYIHSTLSTYQLRCVCMFFFECYHCFTSIHTAVYTNRARMNFLWKLNLR